MSWPLKTSGMPIVPMWTNLIIIFEMTMLSAILATVITLLITAGLPSRGGKLYDPEVSDGYILVGVENPIRRASPRVGARASTAPASRHIRSAHARDVPMSCMWRSTMVSGVQLTLLHRAR